MQWTLAIDPHNVPTCNIIFIVTRRNFLPNLKFRALVNTNVHQKLQWMFYRHTHTVITYLTVPRNTLFSALSSTLQNLPGSTLINFFFCGGGRDSVQVGVQTISGVHPASWLTDTVSLSSGVKQSGREADHSPPLMLRLRTHGALPTLLTPIPSQRRAYLNRDNFTSLPSPPKQFSTAYLQKRCSFQMLLHQFWFFIYPRSQCSLVP